MTATFSLADAASPVILFVCLVFIYQSKPIPESVSQFLLAASGLVTIISSDFHVVQDFLGAQCFSSLLLCNRRLIFTIHLSNLSIGFFSFLY